MAEVRIETAAGTEPEATLRVLTSSQIDELRAAIFSGDVASPALVPTADGTLGSFTETASQTTVSTTTNPVGTDYSNTSTTTQAPQSTGVSNVSNARLVYAISLRELVLAGMASNRGMVLLGIALGFFFQGDFEDRVDMEALEGALPVTQGIGQWVLLIVLAFIALMLLLRVLGIGWYILRFFGYQLTEQGNDLRISCGLFTKVSATVPRQRIQLISIHRSLLMRWMQLATVRIETAGGAGSENEAPQPRFRVAGFYLSCRRLRLGG